MDLLFKRYASPFLLLDEMLISHRFTEFITEFIKIHNEDMENETMWDLWLHKIYDKSFDEFKRSIGSSDNSAVQMDSATFETTINESMEILNEFVPE